MPDHAESVPETSTLLGEEVVEQREDEQFLADVTAAVIERGQDAKRHFLEGYPSRRQEIELLFGLPKFLECEQEHTELKAAENDRRSQRERIERGEEELPDEREYRRELQNIARASKESKEPRRALRQDLTEYTSTITNHIIANDDDPAYLGKFWRSLEKISRASTVGDEEPALNRYKSGWLAGVAAYHLMETFGLHPTLATPKEDVKGVDIHGKVPGQKIAVAFQVKTRKEFSEVHLEVTRDANYPIGEIGRGGERKLYKAPSQWQQRAAMEVGINLPHNSFDWVTGVPTEKGIDQFGDELERLKRELGVEGL